ncbi:PEPxxWA-CTERM sorting domain-containing protein [uncultured Phenylobacterium sp.]|uniref:PEPxxWA-CTERM sorting domain-containing protein n=1 Tax=uncultured Phenylobacterium sp. TaxID=349273 RepID=UPI0025FD0F79|nr:PEPxxWA-CTERM sorting domain-containing protein [uncultured Phenylobacterium sp.]
MTSTTISATKSLLAGVMLACGLMLGTAAQARYTAIDMSDPDNNVYFYFGGYCDTTAGANGDECGKTYTLPYMVDFSGRKTDQLLVRSDGRVQFVGDLLASPPDDINLFDVFAEVNTEIAGEIFDPQLASVLPAPYYLDKEISPNQASLNPIVNYTITTPVVSVAWFTCMSSGDTCFGNLHTLTLTPGPAGFDVAFGGINSKAGYTLAARFDPAQGVPEPSVWALMILGFTGVGATLRSRRVSPAR